MPQVDPRELHALGDALGGSDRVALAAFIDSVDRWIGERLRADDANANANLARLARLAEVWEKINRAARETETYNLERKPLVFSVFGMLAEATRSRHRRQTIIPGKSVNEAIKEYCGGERPRKKPVKKRKKKAGQEDRQERRQVEEAASKRSKRQVAQEMPQKRPR